jgi:hypothetical protein
MEIIKKIAIYYKDMPDSIITYISKDPDMSFTKDGLYFCEPIGKKTPRLTIIVRQSKDKHPLKDKQRLDELYQEVLVLEKTNQIISFTFN